MSHASAPLLPSSSSPSSLANGSSSPIPSHAQQSWESLRKKSRHLETQLYKKLSEFSQVQTAIMNEGRRGGNNGSARHSRGSLEFDSLRSSSSSSSSSSSIAGASTTVTPLVQYDACVADLTDLLRNFNDVNDGLSKLLADTPTLNTSANIYLVQKSRTAQNESQHEFRRTQQNIQAAIARNELMSGARDRSRGGEDGTDTMKGRTEQLLREERGLNHSIRMTDDVIASAVAARDSLLNQGQIFSGVSRKMKQLETIFPVVGKLMNNISCKHQRDMIVLACVIASCMIFTFLYIMSK